MLASKLEFPEFLELREGPLLKRRREGEIPRQPAGQARERLPKMTPRDQEKR